MAASTGKTPAALQNRPELPEHLELYWQAFLELSGSRPQGYGLGPIAWTTIDQWARRYGIDGAVFDRLVMLIGRMDAAWLEHMAKTSKANA